MLTQLHALPQLFQHFPELLGKLEEFFPQEKKLAVAVSGGSDSMLLSCLIYAFRKEKNRNLNQLFFLHCNHGIRKESDQEAQFLSQFFADQQFQLFSRAGELPHREEDLRKWRYAEFSAFMSQKGIDDLALGHNLNDRIESTFLNLIRGCGLKGLFAMQEEEPHYLLDQKRVLRPLLAISKAEIVACCQAFGIPYFQDQSNFDPQVSRRNLIRNQIFEPLLQIGEANQFLASRQKIYTTLQAQTPPEVLKKGKGNPYVASELWYFEPAREEKQLKSLILSVFSQLKIPMQKGILQSLLEWILQGESGLRKVQ